MTDFSYQGFSLSIGYDPSVLTITEVTIAGTIIEELQADFFQANIFPESGGFVVGVLVDALPPFTDREIPGIGLPLTVARVLFDVPADVSPQDTSLAFVDGFGDPPIANVLSVANESFPPDSLTDGVISVTGRPIFVRADANQDAHVDVADPVFILNFIFLDRQAPSCLDAADANDDERLDLADPIFILQYYFSSGLQPPPPFPNPGPDPTPRLIGPDLDCEDSIFAGP